MNATGDAVVVWIDTRDHPGGDLYAQRYDATGNTVGQNFKLTTSSSAFFAYSPAVGMDAAGNFVVAWADSLSGGPWRAKTRAFSAQGAPVTDILELTNPVSESLHPDLVMEPNGRVTYTWLDGRLDADNGRIFAKRAQLTVTEVEGTENHVPRGFALEQNYPNPFNPATQIRYEVSEETHVQLSVVDQLGREVSVLSSGILPSGRYSATWNAENMPSGIYFCRMVAGGMMVMRKMALVK